MKEHIGPEGIANRVRLKRSQFLGAFLIVEGDTDARIYRNFLVEGQCQIVVAFNRDNAIRALAILDSAHFAGVLAIVDADFDWLDGNQPSSSNLFFTDSHDLETMILRSPALEKVLAEFGSEDKLANFVLKGETVLSVLLKSGSHLGYLRCLSLRQQMALRFEDLAFSKFIEAETLTIDGPKLVKTVKDHSSAHHLKEAEIQKQAENLRLESHDLCQVCCGHDLVEILSFGLRKRLGSNDAKQVEPDVLSRSLRLAYEFAYFCSTQLYVSIQGWERSNQPYRVFKSQ